MSREELPRIYELRDLLAGRNLPGAYFGNDFESRLDEEPAMRRQFRELEQELAGLDPAAWGDLKVRAKGSLLERRETRGWQALFDKLNEAYGYNFLRRAGYQIVNFIPTDPTRKMPDLEGRGSAGRALCEVKTINVSDAEARRRTSGGVIEVTDKLGPGFFAKLRSDLEYATAQMAAHDPSPEVRRIVHVTINFDDALHQYADRYSEQIDRYLAHNPIAGLEVVCRWKPPFGSALV